jgi:hypothetical protein
MKRKNFWMLIIAIAILCIIIPVAAGAYKSLSNSCNYPSHLVRIHNLDFFSLGQPIPSFSTQKYLPKGTLSAGGMA